MVEALWSVLFETNANVRLNAGGGVVVLESGRALGGDDSFTFIGSYVVTHGELTGRIRVRRYADFAPSAMGSDNYELDIKGTPLRDGFTLDGVVVGNSKLEVKIRLKRQEELP